MDRDDVKESTEEPATSADPTEGAVVSDEAVAQEVSRELVNRRSSMRGRKRRSRVVGRDFGKSPRKLPRNMECPCGSGLKAKRCCVYVDVAMHANNGTN